MEEKNQNLFSINSKIYNMSQQDKAKKAVVREGELTQFAKALCASEPCRRSRHYRKHRKTNLSRARRRLDKIISVMDSE